MFIYHYKKFIYLIIVLGVLSYADFGYTNVTVESVDSNGVSIQPHDTSQSEASTQEQEIKTNTVSDTFREDVPRFGEIKQSLMFGYVCFYC